MIERSVHQSNFSHVILRMIVSNVKMIIPTAISVGILQARPLLDATLGLS
jgi:hypothetical protein